MKQALAIPKSSDTIFQKISCTNTGRQAASGTNYLTINAQSKMELA
jgi:hypothetical protein